MSKTKYAFASDTYLYAKSVWKGIPYKRSRGRGSASSEGGTTPYGRGRDPKALGDVLVQITKDMGWASTLSQATLIEEWPALVGEPTAGHTEVLSIQRGILQVRCDSTAWTTELRRLRAEIITKINNDYPNAEIRDIKFLPPGAPSWRHGPRTVAGRGPRDTYG